MIVAEPSSFTTRSIFSVQEIAELTNVPTGTVKDRLVTARKQLRALLERESVRLEDGGVQSP